MRIILLFFMCLSVLLVGCKPKLEEAPEPIVGIQVKEGEIVPVDPKTGEPLEVTPCVSAVESVGEDNSSRCAIFDDEFKTLRIAQINVIFSEKTTNSVTCVITFIVDGRKYQFEFYDPNSDTCPKDWYRVP
ncbi:hypothetical protein [Nitrosococcus watsonii]|uniref:Lipoprotein n=1 Tax=Nitrosococcus watsoni (strain C-113) TaxID=105559 RepID=D8K7C5_NITWC|nr:hypothetical protein [Nitrosococcus watsonii]ADJ28802.1 hypothetical protein Nwat_1967 [Nitrosococcus watsonii C-113]